MKTPELLLAKEYIRDATAQVKRAQQHIYLLTMIMNDDDSTHELFDAISEAAERGVVVHVVADTFTYSELGGHIRLNTYFSKRIRAIAMMRRRMERSGAQFTWLGSSALSLVTSRTHSKWLIVDDIVYTFGGTNLYEIGIQSTDYMLKVKDIGLASRLVAEQSRILLADKRGHAYRSHKFTDGEHTVLIDGGFLGDSLIYRRVCALSELAKHITYVSQYCPTGKLGRVLRKKNARLYFNTGKNASTLNKIVIYGGSFMSGNKTLYTGEPYIHAKLMLFEMENGDKVAVTGSHNFSHGGVWLGTKEIALETTDKKVIRELEKFVKKHIA